MSKQITVTIPDEIYNRLTMASDESMRPLATEAVYRIRLGLDSIMYKDLTPKKATPKEAMEIMRMEDSPTGDEVIKKSKKAKLDALVSQGLVSKGFSKEAQLGWNHTKKK